MRAFRRQGTGMIVFGLFLLVASIICRIVFKDFISEYKTVDIEFYCKLAAVLGFIIIILGIIKILVRSVRSKARSAVNNVLRNAMGSSTDTVSNETKYVTSNKPAKDYSRKEAVTEAKNQAATVCKYCNAVIPAGKESCSQCGAPIS